MEEVNHLDQNRQPEEVELHQVLQGEAELQPLHYKCAIHPVQRANRSGLDKWHEEVVARWA
jgi:hypothetical protein